MDEKETWDLIGSFDVLEHIPEDEKALRNMADALRPGGSLVLTVPQHQWLWSETDVHACHVRRYTLGDIAEKLQKAGFRMVFHTSFISLLLPLMALSRCKSGRRDEDAMDEFHIPAWLNQVLENIMKVEFFLIRKGLCLPFGGSLLLVAQKSEAE